MERGSVLFLVSVPGSGERQKGCFFMCHVSGAVSSLDFGAPIFFFISLFSLRASFCFPWYLVCLHQTVKSLGEGTVSLVSGSWELFSHCKESSVLRNY